LRDVLRDTKNVPVISPDELFERANVAAFGCLHQRQFVAYRLSYFWLDGTHSASDATILPPNGRDDDTLLP
jgi:hypothetical protein